MSRLDNTLVQLAPGVGGCLDISGRYRPRHGLAIYCLPLPGWSPSSPGMSLGEALAGRSGLGCTLLDGVPAKVPEGAVVVAKYDDLKAIRPDLLEGVPEPANPLSYHIKLDRSGLVVANSPEALAQGMQTLAMLILRHGEETIPGCLITDGPARPVRCLAVELESREAGIAILMQIVSFAATFKANRIQLILNDDFDAGMEIAGIENFTSACASFGIRIGVRLKLLNAMLSDSITVIQAWSRVRAAARVFGATEAALDDICPGDADPETLRRIVESVTAGETGLPHFSLDARAIVISGVDADSLAPAGVSGWYRMWKSATPPPAEFKGIPLVVDVQAPVLGLTGRTQKAFRVRLDVAMRTFGRDAPAREFMVSFRDIGVSHLWQNFLYPAATGLIAAWGNPADADGAGGRLLDLLYGESGPAIANMWDAVTAAFPPGLSDAMERTFRRTAFGYWPERPEEWRQLTHPDWLGVAEKIRVAAQNVQNAADGLTRNVATLTGARLSLYALSWLHCFTALAPELEARLRGDVGEDGRSEPIAKELFKNFRNWHSCMLEMQNESGLEFAEMPALEDMGMRLRTLCEELLSRLPGRGRARSGGEQGSLTVE